MMDRRRLLVLVPVLADLIVPVGGFFALRHLGMPDVWALTVAGAATAVPTAVNTVRRRRIDSIGVCVLLMVAASAGLLFLTGDPRILLAKPAVVLAVGGCYLLASCLVGVPVATETAKPFATKGKPELVAAYERACTESAPFRRGLRAVTAAWGVALLLDAVLRGVIVFALPPGKVGESFLLSQLPSLVVFVAVAVFTRLRMRPLRAELGRFRPASEPAPDPAAV